MVKYLSRAIPTELSGLVTDCCNILLYLLIHHQTKHMKSNKYTICHEICVYAKFPYPYSVFCMNLEFFHHFPPSRVVQMLPAFFWYYGPIWPLCHGRLTCELLFSPLLHGGFTSLNLLCALRSKEPKWRGLLVILPYDLQY